MVMRIDPPAVEPAPGLRSDFSLRLESALQTAERNRRRRRWLVRGQRAMPILLLIGPIIAWRLILVSPGTAHLAIDALAWVTFLLDVGVHVDAGVLRYTGMQALPSIVGALLLVLVAVTILTGRRDGE